MSDHDHRQISETPTIRKWQHVIWYPNADVRAGGLYSLVMRVRPDGSLILRKLGAGSGYQAEENYSCKHVNDPYLKDNDKARRRDGGWDTVENDRLREENLLESQNALHRKLEEDRNQSQKQEVVTLEELEPTVLQLHKDKIPMRQIVLKLKHGKHPSVANRITESWVDGVLTRQKSRAKEPVPA